jgi:sugar transferase (PEP-CTERM/EpsH1 system associated)
MTQDGRPLIAHVIHRLDVGGMENGVVNLINRIPGDRYRHAVVSLTDSTSFAGRISRADVPIVSLGKKPGQDPGLHWRLFRTFRRLRPAIVHTRNLAAVEAVVSAAAAFVPHRVHGEHGRDVQDPDGSRRRYRWLRRSLSPLVHRFVALSVELEEYLVERVGVPASKVVRIVNGVDLEKFRPAASRREPLPEGVPFDSSGRVVIGSVTRMQEVKDPLTLARAFVRLVERGFGSKACLVLVGEGPLLEEVRKVLQEADASRHAWLIGSREDVPSLLRSFDVFALSSRVEGISNTILEAMASGLPVVATRVGGNGELVENGVTGALVPPGDPEALAEILARYIDQKGLRGDQGRAGRARAEREFGLEAMVARYLAVYDGLLATGREIDLRGNQLRCAE